MNTLRKYKKLAVVGSGSFTDKKMLYFVLDELRKIAPLIDTIVSGLGDDEERKSGADQFAKDYAKDRKLKYIGYKAEWDDMSEPCFKKKRWDGKEFNALAGFNRNTMIAMNCDAGVAFWDGKSHGTKDTIDKFIKFRKPHKIVYYETIMD